MITLDRPTRLPELMGRYLTVAEYHSLIDDGTLGPDDKVELIRGYLVPKVAKNPPHIWTAHRLQKLIGRILDDCWEVVGECPVALPDSEPEPDLSVVRAEAEDSKPTRADCGLIIEVSDSTLRHDRTAKYELFAEAGIPCYWIVNIPDRQVEVFENPNPQLGEYGLKSVYRDGDVVPLVPVGSPATGIPVSKILPKR